MKRLVVVGLAVAAAIWSRPVDAACNIIPGTATTFRGVRGSADRPFAGPGDVVQLRLLPGCDDGAAPLAANADDHVVSIVFTPPNGARHMVVLAADCGALESERERCSRQTGVAGAVCLPTNGTTGPPTVEVLDANGERRLRFRFPDTDALLQALDDDRTLAGPVTIAVTTRSQPLPCELTTSACRQDASQLVCIDSLFAADGTCGSAPDPMFSHFVALPPPNNFQDLCTAPSPPCTGRANEARAAVDADGNILLPMDWRGILLGEGVPIARLLRGSTSVEAFVGSGQPVRIPGNSFLRSFAPSGGVLPPLFDPQADPTAGNEATFFGSADAPTTILRIARRSPTFQQCAGGASAGAPCTTTSDCHGAPCGAATCHGGSQDGATCGSDTDCPSGECGAALFEFRNRQLDGVGPVTVARFGAGVCQAGTRAELRCANDADCPLSVCVSYRVAAQDPVPLEGLVTGSDILAFVVPEAIEGRDLNGDGDARDDVLMLTDRATGVTRPTGVGSAVGRAAIRIRQLPFSFPAVAASSDIVAFLESEAAEGNRDLNGDGDAADTILRVYRLQPEGAVDVLAGTTIVADAAPVINDRSLLVQNDLVFFRTLEAAAAHRVTERANVSSEGVTTDGLACSPSVSADGRLVAFASDAMNLVSDDRLGFANSYVHDRRTHVTQRTNQPLGGGDSSGNVISTQISADGSTAIFVSDAADLVPQTIAEESLDVFARDLSAQRNEQVSLASDGAQGLFDSGDAIGLVCDSGGAAVSSDGQVVAFTSDAPNLVPDDSNFTTDVFVRDRATGKTSRVSLDELGQQLLNGIDLSPISISGHGNVVGFSVQVSATAPLEAYAHDRQTGRSEVVSVSSRNELAEFDSMFPTFDASGRYAAFTSYASNLVAGDTNFSADVFVRDRRSGITERVSVASDGTQQNFDADTLVAASMSADGRYVAFLSDATNLVPSDKNNSEDVFVHDRLTGVTQRWNLDSHGKEAISDAIELSLSANGQVVAFTSDANTLVPGQLDNPYDIYVNAPDVLDTASDLTGDGDLDDTVLRVVDTTTGQVTTLCPADKVVVAGNVAAFLRPEAAGDAHGCPAGPDLNGDGDTSDSVVHVWQPAASVRNLKRAATNLALSDTWLAALLSEADDGGVDLNGDGDTNDSVVAVRRVDSTSDDWTIVGAAADSIAVVDQTVVFLTPESAQGNRDLNGDGDTEDRVLQAYDAASGHLINTGQAAEEFVTGPYSVAFRTRESSQGHTDLDGDGDSDDDVLQVYDIASQRVINSGQSVLPCQLEACDPRTPYRVLNNTVKFLTFEANQSQDLNGDGDDTDVVLQTFNVPLALQQLRVALRRGVAPQFKRTHRIHDAILIADSLTTIGSVRSGLCTTNAKACVTDADCGGGVCFVPPGGCVLDLGTHCDPKSKEDCQSSEFCVPSGVPGEGTCHVVQGPCRSSYDCQAPAVCNDGGSSFQRLAGPLTGDGSQVFIGAGRCVESTTTPCDACKAGQYCGPSGTCEREHGACQSDRDCPSGSVCSQDLVLSTARDSDGDELPDPFDNCPTVPNVTQEDADGDGVGDACDGAFNPAPTTTPQPSTTPTAAPSTCTADCDGDGLVTVDEVVRAVAIALEQLPISVCVAADASHDGIVTVDELVGAVIEVLDGCPPPTLAHS
ncbi:MAG TPA: hypothetical protein VMT89_05665 [Candidatus Acidoferrales bacterium]|nr:hypothetical protein [Candidatus Acidoferrales bacterium]